MNTIPAQEIKRRGIAAVDDLIAKGDLHIIRNNQPQYVVLSQKRYEDLLEAHEEAQRGSYPRVAGRSQGRAGDVVGTAEELIQALRSGRLSHVHPRLDDRVLHAFGEQILAKPPDLRERFAQVVR